MLTGLLEAGAGDVVAFAAASRRGARAIDASLEGVPIERHVRTLPLAYAWREAWSALKRPRLEGVLGAFDVFHLSDKLRQRGWIVPAYTLPPDAEHVELLRVVVRNDMSRERIEFLFRHLTQAYDELSAADALPTTDADRKNHANGHKRC